MSNENRLVIIGDDAYRAEDVRSLVPNLSDHEVVVTIRSGDSEFERTFMFLSRDAVRDFIKEVVVKVNSC